MSIAIPVIIDISNGYSFCEIRGIQCIIPEIRLTKKRCDRFDSLDIIFRTERLELWVWWRVCESRTILTTESSRLINDISENDSGIFCVRETVKISILEIDIDEWKTRVFYDILKWWIETLLTSDSDDNTDEFISRNLRIRMKEVI